MPRVPIKFFMVLWFSLLKLICLALIASIVMSLYIKEFCFLHKLYMYRATHYFLLYQTVSNHHKHRSLDVVLIFHYLSTMWTNLVLASNESSHWISVIVHTCNDFLLHPITMPIIKHWHQSSTSATLTYFFSRIDRHTSIHMEYEMDMEENME